MKKLITLLFAVSVFANTYAQYCGNPGPFPFGNPSDSTECTNDTTISQDGFYPVVDSLPPFVNGVSSSVVLQLHFSSAFFGGGSLTIQSFKFDTIENLPPGLCWATNKPNNTFDSTGGCVKINGICCAPPGQYKLNMFVTANVGFNVSVNADAAGLKYYLRVKNNGDADIEVDTGQTKSNPFISYGGAGTGCTSGINNMGEPFNSLTIAPNPFTGKAIVSFFSNGSGVFSEKIIDLLGNEVDSRKVEVRQGENKIEVEGATLASGIYFYSLTDGKNTLTKKVVIE